MTINDYQQAALRTVNREKLSDTELLTNGVLGLSGESGECADLVKKADIKELHQEDIPKADVWSFGFPCTDLSVAGKQKGLTLKCQDCGEVIKISPEGYTGENTCPKCGSKDLRAESRSGCFFEIMRLLEETERERGSHAGRYHCGKCKRAKALLACAVYGV